MVDVFGRAGFRVASTQELHPEGEVPGRKDTKPACEAGISRSNDGCTFATTEGYLVDRQLFAVKWLLLLLSL